MNKIVWFKTGVHEEEATAIREALLQGRVSMGAITEDFEARLAQRLGVPYCLVTPSGSVALFIAIKALGIGAGDEVIVPNRGWVAAAHAVMLAGAKVVLAEVRRDIPNIDVADVRRKISSRTKAVIPLHLNGRSCDMPALLALARERKIAVIEDACQALLSRNADSFIGTQGELGCFSLGMAKLVATGQGGFVVTRDEGLYRQLKLIRNHGVKDNFTDAWYQWGFNFKFTDIQASMGIVQLERAAQRIEHLKAVYTMYDQALAGMKKIAMIPVKNDQGEVPLYIEALTEDRDELIKYFTGLGIQTRPATPDLDPTIYFEGQGSFENSRKFFTQGIYLPGGPEQPLENVQTVISALKSYLL